MYDAGFVNGYCCKTGERKLQFKAGSPILCIDTHEALIACSMMDGSHAVAKYHPVGQSVCMGHMYKVHIQLMTVYTFNGMHTYIRSNIQNMIFLKKNQIHIHTYIRQHANDKSG